VTTVLDAAPIHALVYGDPGMRKSTLAASFPAKILVANFDSPANIRPYIERGTERGGSYQHFQDNGVPEDSLGLVKDASGAPVPTGPVTIVRGASGRIVVEVRHFQDTIPSQPSAWRRFDVWFNLLVASGKLPATMVLDTVSGVELAARKQDQYVDNRDTRNSIQWWGAASRALEELLCIRLPNLPCHVVAVCHMDEDQDAWQGRMVRNPALPNKLRRRVSGFFSDMWRVHCEFDNAGATIFKVQTQASPEYFAKSAVRAPNGSAPNFNALVGNLVNGTARAEPLK